MKIKPSPRFGKRNAAARYQIGAMIRAIRADQRCSDLNDLVSVVLCTALNADVIRGLRWSDFRPYEGLLLVRSASIHTTAIEIPKWLIDALRARRAKHGEDEFLFSRETIEHAVQELRRIGEELCGREITIDDFQTAVLNRWIRRSPHTTATIPPVPIQAAALPIRSEGK